MTRTTPITGAAREAAEDLFFGQVVIVWARWFVIGGAALLSLWSAPSEGALAAGIALVVALMAVNFLLHARHLAEQPANRSVVVAASLFDLLAITLMVATWPGENGLESRYFVFYYPLVFAFALVFAPRLAAGYTALALGSYVATCLVLDGEALTRAAQVEPLVMRVITLGAMGCLGMYYWRVQRARRRHDADADPRMATIMTPDRL